MTRGFLSVALSALALALPARAAPPAAPSVGTIAVQPRTADGEYDPAMPAFVEAAEAALTARGFTILDDPAHASFLADLTLARGDVGTGVGRDPDARHLAVGPGVIVPLSTGASHLSALRRSSLALSIRRRAGGVAWSGTAVTVRQADTRTGTDEAVAADLSRALLGGYPAMPTEVIGVP